MIHTDIKEEGKRMTKNRYESIFFQISILGQIQKATIDGILASYCKYSYSFGKDWSLINGLDHGLTQFSKINQLDSQIVWNYPLEITFRSSSPKGWPRLVLSCYGLDFRGNEYLVGYGSCLIPSVEGEYTINIPIYKTTDNTMWDVLISMMTGNFNKKNIQSLNCDLPERETLNVQYSGNVEIKLELVTRKMKKCGIINAI